MNLRSYIRKSLTEHLTSEGWMDKLKKKEPVLNITPNTWTHATGSKELIVLLKNGNKFIGNKEDLSKFNLPDKGAFRTLTNQHAPNFKKGELFSGFESNPYVITTELPDSAFVPNWNAKNYENFDDSQNVGVLKPEFRDAKYFKLWQRNKNNEYTLIENHLLVEAYDDVSMDYIKSRKKLSDYQGYDNKMVIGDNTYLNFTTKDDSWFLYGEITVFDNKDETEIANSSYGKPREHSYMKATIDVRSDKRRTGIASNIYTWIEKLTGHKLYPDTLHSKSAEALWNNPNRNFGTKQINENLNIDITKKTEPAPYFGNRFGQDVEPKGTYVTQGRIEAKGYVNGIARLKKPLFINVTDSTLIQYKRDLAIKFKAKGQKLTNKLMELGYDSIITVNEDGKYSEIVLFPNSSFMMD